MRPRSSPPPAGCLGDALSGLLDGELDGDQEDHALAHLARCPDCAAELAAVGRARSWVRALPPVVAPPGLYERLLRGALPTAPAPPPPGPPAASGPRHRRRRAVAGVAAAAALALTVAGPGSPAPPESSPAVPRLVDISTPGPSAVDLMSKLEPVAFRP